MNAATLARYQHEERMAQATKVRGDLPSFSLKRSTASGSLGVIGIDVNVPVGEEYKTAQEAKDAAVRFMEELCAKFPMPDGNVRAK
jgi:hypothetical protein